MGEKKVILHATWGSPFSNRVEIALKLKGVDYQHIEEDLSKKTPELLRYNPIYKKIPVLVHGTNAISESQVILEYIDETWDSGFPLLPLDPYERALARFWARFIDDKLFPSIHKVFFLGDDMAMNEAKESMKFLDKELEGKRFFGGESVGFVDIVGINIAYWVGVFEEAADKVMLTSEDFPSVCRWRDELLGNEVIQQSLPTPKSKLAGIFRGFILKSISGLPSDECL
ncbi:hypothetical protein V2J09_006014 [Rumex salicifolius]